MNEIIKAIFLASCAFDKARGNVHNLPDEEIKNTIRELNSK